MTHLTHRAGAAGADGEAAPALHLLSDATGETVALLAEAALAQFEPGAFRRRDHVLLRRREQVETALAAVAAEPGPVLYTLSDPDLAARVRERCAELGREAVDVLEPAVAALARAAQAGRRRHPGGRHAVDRRYFDRVSAIEFAIASDDGRESDRYARAEVILAGVSRVSKTPTCIYLACRGVRAANMALAPGVAPSEGFERAVAAGAPVVGLTIAPARLAQIRAERLVQMGETPAGPYADPAAIRAEIAEARLLFARVGAHVIDVTRRSIEETAAEIMVWLRQRRAA